VRWRDASALGQARCLDVSGCGPAHERVRASLAIAVATTTLYVAGACPTIFVGDSGELVTAVDRLGIPHPTGYPLYVLAGKLCTLLLPIGSVAWRLSVFSALAAGATVAGLYLLCRRLGTGPIAAATGALLFAVSPSFWGEANVQRVYALNALFVVAATHAVLSWRQRPTTRALAGVFFLCGLGATNHAFMALYGAVAGVYVAVVGGREVRRPVVVASAAGAFAVGLLPYLYLPLRSRADPVLDWGNPETLRAFLTVVTRRHFWSRAWLEGPADLWPIARDFVASIPLELGWAGAALSSIGLVAARARAAPLGLLGLLVTANVATLAAHGSRADLFIWHRYYIPTYLMAALLAGLGCEAVVVRLPRWLRAAPLAVPVLAAIAHWPDLDRSRYRVAEDFATAVIDALPPGAHLAATDDNVLFALMYVHLVERRRPDVDLILQGVGGPSPQSLRFDPYGERLFFTHHPNWDRPDLAIVPAGLVFEARRPGTRPAPLAMPETLAGEDDPHVPKDFLTRNLIGHFHYMRGVSLAAIDPTGARRELDRAAAAAPDDDVLFYNLALVHRRAGRIADALGAARRAQALNPRALATTKRVRPDDLVVELERAAAGSPAARASP
jgi:hypothetical protein